MIKKFALLLIAAMFAAIPAMAQSGPPTPPPVAVLSGVINSIAVSNASGRNALPSTAASANAVTVYNNGTKDVFIALGGSTVVATTNSFVVHPGAPIVLYTSGGYIASITGGTDTSNITVYQGNGPILAKSGGTGTGGAGCTGSYCGQTAGTGVIAALSNTANASGGVCTVGGGGCAGGAGAVNQVQGANQVNCSPITGNVVCSGTFPSKAITGAYPIVSTDGGIQLVLNSASAIALTIPAANSAGFTAGANGGFALGLFGKGAGTGTITPASGTINGASSATVSQNQDCILYADVVTTTNYILTCYGGASGGVSSFNGRSGAVSPATSDYSFSQISGLLGLGSQVSGILGSANGGAGSVSGIEVADGAGNVSALNIGANLSYNSGTKTLSATAGGSGCVTSGSSGNPLTDNGAGGCTSNSTLPINKLAAIAADNIIGNPTGGSASPQAMALPSCTGAGKALTYDTTGHAIGCNTISGASSYQVGSGNTGSITGTANKVYTPFGNGNSCGVAAPQMCAISSARTINITNLQFNINAATATAGTIISIGTFSGTTLTDTVLTCTIGVGTTTCTDSAHTASLSANQLWVIHINQQGTVNSGIVSWSFDMALN